MTMPSLVRLCGVFVAGILVLSAAGRAAELGAIPGPDDQGGMIMPVVTLSGNSLGVMFTPPVENPVLSSLASWSSGDTFSPSASWYAALDPVGGAGALFNNRYGFTFMGSVPSGRALGISLVSASAGLTTWNYVNIQNRFDQILAMPGSQVLWNGSMWHPYFLLPEDAVAGTYSATFEVFVAHASFVAGTGLVDYSTGALSAARDFDYDTVSVTYNWQVEGAVIPEPRSALGAGLAGLALCLARRRRG